METVTLSRHRTHKGRWFTVRAERLNTDEVLVQVLEDSTVVSNPGEGHDFFTEPIAVSWWDGTWQWRPPQVAGRAIYPKFCEIVTGDYVDEWVDAVAPLVDEEVDDDLAEVNELLRDRIELVLDRLDTGELDLDGVPRMWAPEAGQVVLDEAEPTLWAWWPHPAARFDPASDATIDVTVPVPAELATEEVEA